MKYDSKILVLFILEIGWFFSCQSALRTMPVRRIKNDIYGDPGLDFMEFFGCEELVREALDHLRLAIDATCYCFKFCPVEGTQKSNFVPYPSKTKPPGFLGENVKLPDEIPYYRLVNVGKNAKGEEIKGDDAWPPLGEWTRDPNLDSDSPKEFESRPFYGLIRLQVGDTYVGYFKAVWNLDPDCDFEEELNRGRESVRRFLTAQIPKLRAGNIQVSEIFRSQLTPATGDTHQLLSIHQPRRALQLVCALITSHFGAWFNRIVCLGPSSDSELHCVWAHGNDRSNDSPHRLQESFGKQLRYIRELVDLICKGPEEPNDRLYDEVAKSTNRLRIGTSSASAIAKIWRRKGDLSLFKSGQLAVSPKCKRVDENGQVILPSTEEQLLAVIIGRDDDVFAGDRWPVWRDNPSNMYFALPWKTSERLLAVVVVDMGHWADFGQDHDIYPRLMMTDALLHQFAPLFERRRPVPLSSKRSRRRYLDLE